jgi:hypothetical protein
MREIDECEAKIEKSEARADGGPAQIANDSGMKHALHL